MANDDIRRFSLASLEKQHKRRSTDTADAAPARHIDAEFWDQARVVMPTPKHSVHLRLDADVLGWFKGQGKGHLTRMNAVLRSFMETHQGDKS